ncbi:radical SAM protein [Rhodanobacter thiooxydans]|uniref:Radical SAM protein n=1 Tax=Rhodanobacter thiooxydans TaxID=416169 RepID=A0A154QEI4_9GAMM|nr:arsenosugar biosynthesis radical SAM (seleno)protein ArsS [Rhodanobacter thiooxydans]EIL99258.1 Radical SAM domain-containing protein [Rhodanobacter thiooxydans LCS2]KZC22707.1 radical SAM protein [Rhodanobacter thiooxydans]MCW0202078.1 arsenosugar biosynthesis radical SAM protein ArsS [Rhodanobacter thiooxydans]
MNAVPSFAAPSFARSLREHGVALPRTRLEILQVNVGKLCDLACQHCHVEAGPGRTEIMQAATVERILELLANAPGVHTVDLTGGAPELNPHFRTLVRGSRALGKTVIDRCNLTVLFRPGQEDTAEFLAAQGVKVVASLPCYSKANVEQQRGQHVFDPSLRALHRLNALGYGRAGFGLELDLVYNPLGATLPPAQAALEATYRRELAEHFGIVFNHLFTITNMPIKRFLHLLEREGRYERYMQTLLDAFNPRAALGVMCRNLLSVSWDGELFDCDFNQALGLPLGGRRRSLWEIDTLADAGHGPIAFADHCYGCTAGAGSSCGGSLT